MYPERKNLSINKIIICIPITLKSREAIEFSLLYKYGSDYLFLGDFFKDNTTNESCAIATFNKVTEDDSDLVHLFSNLGQGKISNATLEQINNYQQVVYLISYDLGYDACLKMAKFTQVFLSISGIAVKVDSAGVVCEKDKWLANYNSDDVFDIYSLFVTLIEGENYYYSSGMSNFALADVSIALTEDIGLAIYVMNVFNYYRLTDTVTLEDGETFQPDSECPVYQMQWSECDEYEISNPLHNFYGKWHLSRINNDLEITYQIN